MFCLDIQKKSIRIHVVKNVLYTTYILHVVGNLTIVLILQGWSITFQNLKKA